MSVTVTYDYNFIKDATKETEGLVQRIYENRRYKIAQAFIDIVTPFVPVKSGDLRLSADIVDDGYAVKWSATNPRNGYDYAERQYKTEEYIHPRGGTDHWDTEAMFYEGETFLAKCEEILRK